MASYYSQEHGFEQHCDVVAHVIGSDVLAFAKDQNASYLVEKATPDSCPLLGHTMFKKTWAVCGTCSENGFLDMVFAPGAVHVFACLSGGPACGAAAIPGAPGRVPLRVLRRQGRGGAPQDLPGNCLGGDPHVPARAEEDQAPS